MIRVRQKKYALHFLAVVAITAMYLLTQKRMDGASLKTLNPRLTPTASSTIAVINATTTNAFVVQAVDGDTLTVRIDGETGENTVRLLGVNTPETVDPRRSVECFGKEASAFVRALVEGRRVRLEADVQADEVDKYHRLLRNVILEDGTDLNALLIREGYAYAYVSFPQNKKRKVELKRLQVQARVAKRGLWNPKTCNGKK